MSFGKSNVLWLDIECTSMNTHVYIVSSVRLIQRHNTGVYASECKSVIIQNLKIRCTKKRPELHNLFLIVQKWFFQKKVKVEFFLLNIYKKKLTGFSDFQRQSGMSIFIVRNLDFAPFRWLLNIHLHIQLTWNFAYKHISDENTKLYQI